MVITAKYSDNATRVVTGWTYSPTGALGNVQYHDHDYLRRGRRE